MNGYVHYRSTQFIPTIREAPAEASQPSHKYMIRAGLVRQLGSGAYTKLPLGYAVYRRLDEILDDEMRKRGAARLHFPAIQPVSIWKDAGRFDSYGDDMFAFEDRHGRETCMAPTHEIAAALMAATDIHSYKDLPCRVYQTQIKYRDEVRPRGGVLRTREFTMHDLYSFDATDVDAEVSYSLFHGAYVAVFRRIGLPVVSLQTDDTGAIGGKVSHEFLFATAAGESEFWIDAESGEPSWVSLPDESASIRTTGLELAHTFQLGVQYSSALNVYFDKRSGGRDLVRMCSFGLGLERTIAAVVEHSLSERNRMVWPLELAPYYVNIVLAADEASAEVHTIAAQIASHLVSAGLGVMIDDRPIRAGVKFGDGELLGARWEVVVGRDVPSVGVRDLVTDARADVYADAVAALIAMGSW